MLSRISDQFINTSADTKHTALIKNDLRTFSDLSSKYRTEENESSGCPQVNDQLIIGMNAQNARKPKGCFSSISLMRTRPEIAVAKSPINTRMFPRERILTLPEVTQEWAVLYNRMCLLTNAQIIDPNGRRCAGQIREAPAGTVEETGLDAGNSCSQAG